MSATRKPLFDLTAADVMSRDVRTIHHTLSLPHAAHLLIHDQISGVPVVDDHGCCIGVLSAMDFVRSFQKEPKKVLPRFHIDADFWEDWRKANLSNLPKDEVRRHMSADPVISTPEALLTKVARQMLDAHIHRVIVVDKAQHPIGIVSSTDILAAVAYAEPKA